MSFRFIYSLNMNYIGEKMARRKKENELFKKYMRWPIFAMVLSALATASVFVIDRSAAVVVGAFALVNILFLLNIYIGSRKKIVQAMTSFALTLSEDIKRLADELDVPFGIMDEQGAFSFLNIEFEALMDSLPKAARNITEMFEAVEPYKLANIEYATDYHEELLGRRYRVHLRKLVISDTVLFGVYLYDETEIMALKQANDDQKLVTGLIYLDNYEEALESVEEVRSSLLTALIDRKINQYIDQYHGVLRSFDKDKYFFVVEKRYFRQMSESRFDILEQVKTVNIGNDINITLSIGIGLGSGSYDKNFEYSRMAIDMALGRGGDQAVIKENENITYYGGRSQSVEKSTRVKARVKAHAFKGLLESKRGIIIMGHKLLDIDAFGAAIGFWRIAKEMDKSAHIVLGEITSSLKPMLDRFHTSEYPDDLFVTGAQAMELLDEDMVLLVVDVNRPSLTEAPELLEKAESIAVVDHHRQSADVIEGAILSYIEPFASSASEMVSEIVQYITDTIHLRPAEADAMYAGIVIDTQSFTNQTGVRTFEAAAFLRKKGADVIRVRKLFRESAQDYTARAKAISSASIYHGSFAIAICQAQGVESPTIVGAQAANELLNIVGVKASIVITQYKETIYLSARSIDEVNVQVLMEKLGGGGHRGIAGAQLKDVSEDEAVRMVKDAIDEMEEKGEVS